MTEGGNLATINSPTDATQGDVKIYIDKGSWTAPVMYVDRSEFSHFKRIGDMVLNTHDMSLQPFRTISEDLKKYLLKGKKS